MDGTTAQAERAAGIDNETACVAGDAEQGGISHPPTRTNRTVSPAIKSGSPVGQAIVESRPAGISRSHARGARGGAVIRQAVAQDIARIVPLARGTAESRVQQANLPAAKPETPVRMEVATPSTPAASAPAGHEAEPAPEPRITEDQDPRPSDVAPVEIAIDPNLTGGFILGRFDIQMRGRVVSRTSVEEIVLQVDGRQLARSTFGVRKVSPAVTRADGSQADQYSFQFSLPRVQSRAAGPCAGSIVVRMVDGQTHEEPFELTVDPLGPAPVQLMSGPTHTSDGKGVFRPPAILYVERATLNDGGTLTVDGWAVALTPVVAIQVFAGESRLGAAKLGRDREDVAAAYPSYPNCRSSGFMLSADLPSMQQTPAAIRIEVHCRDGFAQELTVPLERVRGGTARAAENPQIETAAALPFTMQAAQPSYQLATGFQLSTQPFGLTLATSALEPSASLSSPGAGLGFSTADPTIHMFCDTVALTGDGILSVSGWAVCAAGISRIAVCLDEEFVGLAELGHERPDVGREHTAILSARYAGFQFEKKIKACIEGEHTIRVVVRNGEDQERTESITVAATVIETSPEPVPDARQMSEEERQEFRFELDNPHLVAGAVPEPIAGRLTIEGWVLARSGVSGIDVLLDDQRLGEAHYGLARQDVGAAFPDWDNALRSGYAFHCQPRSLKNGSHTVSLIIRARNGKALTQSFRIEVRKPDGQDEGIGIRRKMSRVEADVLSDLLGDLAHRPGFSIFLKLPADVREQAVHATLSSLRHQAYREWRVCVLADSEAAASMARVWLDQAGPEIALRASVVTPADSAWHEPLASQQYPGILYGILCAGDELGCDALGEFALLGGLYPDSDLLYADESRISPISQEREPFFKPDFSPDLLLSTNYIGRPWFATGQVLAATSATPASLTADGEFDLILRCTEQAVSIRHVPKLLCARGQRDLDSAAAEQTALVRAAERRGFTAEVVPSPVSGTWRVKRTATVAGKVSIIIPTCAAHGYVETCITTLRDKTAYRNFEIICIDNIPDSQLAWKIWLQRNADKIVDIPDAFNWSRFNNRAAEVAEGEFLLFLNDDIEIQRADWLDSLLEHAARPEIGIAGPQLLYPDRKVQHAGMFLTNDGVARHAFRFAAEDEPGYFGLALTQRNVVAVTGACMLMRRTTFAALGGFDEVHQITNNDLDFCLRAHRAGLLTVYTPYATLIHHELASRDRLKDVFDLTYFNATWKNLFSAGDPFFSPRLSRHSDDYRPDEEPMEVVYSGNPLFRADEIRRILVVKLDHIGDFITAIPSMRRMKELFPSARITVLAGRAARAFAMMEDAIDSFEEFEFFHARSGLGRKELTKDDYLALNERLRPYQFDLAVDLRKQPDTRDVLRYTSARFLAGFEHMAQFPFLDIAVEWEGDPSLHRKRAHVTDDMLSLVETVGKAARSQRTHITLPAGAAEAAIANLPPDSQALFAKPVVAIHPGVGTVMRQWPAEHFAALIDLMVERDDVNAILIGGPDEAELADEVLASVSAKSSVISLVGKTPLRDLPGLLARCALYVGNNSGPKHIAAALGVPTIGIHSGVVDAIEWGPVGQRAVALRRSMACSPCYLARPDDCPRALACLRGLEPTLVHETARAFLARRVPTARPVGQGQGLGQLPGQTAPATDHGDQPTMETAGSSMPGMAGRVASSPDTTSGQADVTGIENIEAHAAGAAEADNQVTITSPGQPVTAPAKAAVKPSRSRRRQSLRASA